MPGAKPEPAEGPAPMTANRLWDASHVNDKSQVIASSRGDQQSFQIVNMDVRFVYRIGLSDQDALAATYNNADVPTLIRSTASRILVHDFASRTLDGLLGADRVGLGDEIGRAVQAICRSSTAAWKFSPPWSKRFTRRPAPPMLITACKRHRSARRR
jgi:hypothetical protein